MTPDGSEGGSDLDLGEDEEADHDNDLTIDQSYDVSAWGLSDDSSDTGDEAHTSLTNISDESEEPQQHHQISVDLDRDPGSDLGSSGDEEDSEDDNMYKTEWFCHYEAQKRLLESNKRCITTDLTAS